MAIAGVRRRSEGGLYRHRYGVFLIIFLFPVLVSSVSFYIDHTYEEYVYWAFFRVWTGPWHFSWTFRHVIVVMIMIIYISIYVYVMSQFKSVSRSMKKRAAKLDLDAETSNDDENRDCSAASSDDDDDESDSDVFLNTFGDSMWYKIFQFLSMFVFPDVHISAKLHGHDLNTNEDLANIERLKNESIINESVNWSNNNGVGNGVGNDVTSSEILGLNSSFANVQNKEISKQIQSLLYEEAMQRFATRKSQIMRQMKVIFIYPISYIILWILPFINHYQVIRTGTESLWSTAPSAIFQALNCFVDVLVFLIREKPWQLTKDIDDITGMSPFVSQGSSSLQPHGWRRRVSWLPGYGDYSVDSEGVDSTNMELEKGSLSNRVAYGRNSQTQTLHEDDEHGADYDYEQHLGSFEAEKGSLSLSRPNSKGYPETNDEDDNDAFDQELDLKDFLNANSPGRSSQRKKRVNYHSAMGRPRSKPSSLSMTAANPTNQEPNAPWGPRGSLTSSNRSNINGTGNSRRNSHLSWRTWSFGSSPSNTTVRQRQDKDLDPIFGSFINDNNKVENKLKLKECSNDVNWNLHMFDHSQRRVYESKSNMKSNTHNGFNYSSSNSSSYRHNSSSSNNGSHSNGSSSIKNSYRDSNNHNNSNAGFDEEMDLMDFLKLGTKG